jgi:hypothetical protein
MVQQELMWIVDGFLVSNIGGLGATKVMKKIGKSLFNIGGKSHFMCLLEAGEINIPHEGRTLETVNSEGSLVRWHWLVMIREEAPIPSFFKMRRLFPSISGST